MSKNSEHMKYQVLPLQAELLTLIQKQTKLFPDLKLVEFVFDCLYSIFWKNNGTQVPAFRSEMTSFCSSDIFRLLVSMVTGILSTSRPTFGFLFFSYYSTLTILIFLLGF